MEECGEFRHGEDFPALLNCLKCIIYEDCKLILINYEAVIQLLASSEAD